MLNLKWILMGVLLSGSLAVAENENPPSPGVRLYSHYELGLLTVEQRVEYMRMLREVLKEAEKDQTNRGIKYGTAMNSEFHPWFNALIDTADAQTQREQGGTCVFAGGFSTYGAPRMRSCINNRPCDGNRAQIRCEPLLYGDICTRANDGATSRCDSELKKRNIDDAVLAAEISQPEKRPAWESFRAKFEGFCRGVLGSAKDVNFKSCKRVEARIKALEAKIAVPPPEPTVQAPAPVPAAPQPPVIQRQTQRVNCDRPATHSCFNCPAPDRVTTTRAATEADVGTGKFAQLLKIMANACGVKNDDSAHGVSAKSLGELVAKFGVCSDADYGPAGNYANDTDKKLIEDLVNGNADAHQDMSGGLYHNKYSIAMERYFGIGGKDAREAFCKGGLEESVSILRRAPMYVTSGEGGSITGAEMAAAVDAKRGAPMGANHREFEEFKSIYLPRKKLAACVGRNSSGPGGRQVSATILLPKSCVLEHVTVNPDVLSHVVKQFVVEAGSTCIEAQGQRPVRCDHFNGQALECTAQLPTVPARVSQLKCVSQAPQATGAGDRSEPAR